MNNREAILIMEVAKKLGVELESEEQNAIFKRVESLQKEGYSFWEANGSLELLILKELGMYRSIFKFERVRVFIDLLREDNSIDATLKVLGNGKSYSLVAEGVGPVDALDNVLEIARKELYPKSLKIKLLHYNVVDVGGQGTAAKVRVISQFTDGVSFWGIVSIHRSSIHASWQNLVDSYELSITKYQLGSNLKTKTYAGKN